MYIGSISDLENQLVGYRVDMGEGRRFVSLFSGDWWSIWGGECKRLELRGSYPFV